MDKFSDTETPFDTCLTMIGHTIWSGDGSGYFLILDLELELAANPTIWASSEYLAVRQTLPLTSSLRQGSGRAGIDASSAEFAAYFLKWAIESRAYQSVAPPVGKRDGSHLAYLLAHADAATAKDAQVIISVEERVISINGELLMGIRESHFF
ncbi:unnamed protein product [marine sediment metagenome]|uniref:Uncharacterized protein n=1 Tax=marine sediment metagenome TaxID=412755 RepID=X1ET01_9ZZZZ